MHKPNLVPFFESKLGSRLTHGKAHKEVPQWLQIARGLKRYKTRYFELLVIATDENGVWFEGWHYESAHRSSDCLYSGVTYVDLDEIESIVEAQMIACDLLPYVVTNAIAT